MPSLTISDLVDLNIATIKDLGYARFQNIAQETQHLEVFSRWFKKDRMDVSGGTAVQRNIMTTLPDSAAHVGLLDPDNPVLQDLMATFSVPWVHASTNWIVLRHDALVNKGKAFVFNVVKPRRLGAMTKLAEVIEAKAWSSPLAANTLEPYGVPYWIVKNATTGFNGGLPGDHTTLAGLNLTQHPNFKNYTVTYTALDKADGIPKMRTMHRKVRFKSPFEAPQYATQLADKYRVYVNETTVGAYETLGEAQNENLGRDVAPMWVGDVARGGGGNIMFRGHPIIWIPTLDADTSNPNYMINHETFRPQVLAGDYLHEHTKEAPNQHNVVQNFVDISYNYLCVDRRQNGVMYIA
jgi:hypothetical protein